jgi:hypothetical protein
MAINKQITLGRKPEEVGVKDAIHVAIVSCRAGEYLTSSEKVTLNEHREAVAPQGGAKHIGIVDPFLKGSLAKGDTFWMVMIPKQDQVVRHVWEHALDFSAPERAIQECEYLAPYAKQLGITYSELMHAADVLVNDGETPKYEGTITETDTLESVLDDMYDFWSEWSDETGYEFENIGSMCCPERDFPSSFELFDYSHLDE